MINRKNKKSKREKCINLNINYKFIYQTHIKKYWFFFKRQNYIYKKRKRPMSGSIRNALVSIYVFIF